MHCIDSINYEDVSIITTYYSWFYFDKILFSMKIVSFLRHFVCKLDFFH